MQEWKTQSARVVKDELDITKRKSHLERGVQLIVTCGVSSKEAMKACSEHRAVLELPGETAAHIFETCVEQYLSEVLSSSIEILTIPMQRKSRFLKCRKE